MNEQLISERKKLLTSIEKLLEGPMIFLGFVWLILLIVELIWGLSKALEYTSLSIWFVFIVDFIIKIILDKFLRSFYCLIIVAFLPLEDSK